jgi:hypothetical protein
MIVEEETGAGSRAVMQEYDEAPRPASPTGDLR